MIERGRGRVGVERVGRREWHRVWGGGREEEEIMQEQNQSCDGWFLRSPARVEGNAVRLVGGSSGSEGRVEIFYNGQWGTVCDDYWNDLNARVVCQQLGFYGNSYATSGAQFGPGARTQPIWLDDVRCVGSEEYLSGCPNRGWGVHNCFHWEDAGVICRGEERGRRMGRVGGRASYLGTWGGLTSVCSVK